MPHLARDLLQYIGVYAMSASSLPLLFVVALSAGTPSGSAAGPSYSPATINGTLSRSVYCKLSCFQVGAHRKHCNRTVAKYITGNYCYDDDNGKQTN